jgi:RNA methyltransferase, TrmH family
LPISRNELKNVRSLQNRKGRRDQGLFLAEGVRLLEEALRFRRIPNKLFYSPSLLSERGSAVVGEFEKKSAETVEVPASDLKRMAPVETSQGMVAVFAYPETNLAELNPGSLRNVIVCENLADPGNVGTMIRTALAFNFDLVLLCGHTVDPYSPKVVRSSVGAIFGLPVVTAETEAGLAFLGKHDVPLLAAALSGTKDIRSCLTDLKDKPLALAIGSEAEGLSESMIDRAFAVVRIDHHTQVESLNSAVAGAILMKECYDR